MFVSPSNFRPPQDEPEEVPWEDLVKWAEADLRHQLARRLGPGSQITPSSVIGSTFRRAVAKPVSVPRRFRDACNWLFRISGRVASEKSRNARAWKRKPKGANVLPIGGRGELLGDFSSLQEQEQLMEIIELIPLEQKALIRAVYFDGDSIQAFANHVGIAPREASRLHQHALTELKKLIPLE